MKYASFQHFYERELSKPLREVEKTRLQLKKKRIKIALLVLPLLAVLAYFAMQYIAKGYLNFAFPLLFIGVAFLVKTPANFRHHFKTEIIEKIIHKMNDEFKYDDSGYIPKYEFNSSKLFSQNISRYQGEDYIAGKIENTEFYLSEVLAQYVTQGKNSQTRIIFQGIFFVADFHKNFQKETFVLPDIAEKGFGFLGRKFQKWNMSRPPLVILENTRFEKKFVVYSEDQTEARYILSSSMMENILIMREKFGRDLHISFIGSKIHIAIPLRKPWLEPRFWGTLIDTQQLEDYHDTIKLMTQIIEDLNLNRRIWTKK